MKHEYPTYLKSIRKSKTLAATLSDAEPKDDSDNEDEGIRNVFTDENSKIKSYITRQFKKFTKNANGKGFDKDRRQSSTP